VTVVDGMSGRPVLRVLDREDCDRLLATETVGRIAYTDGALPQVFPVNYAMDGNAIVLRTAASSRLAHCCHDSVVAFEVDDLDREAQRGWSVLVVGTARPITDEGELVRARQLPFAPWAGGEREHFLRITPGIVSGRLLD
jgi:nitroimidazol reductase NimA-like FMN-containing flavoprotein (pyridoxamine 5'-phosphate oxidase superfamily)